MNKMGITILSYTCMMTSKLYNQQIKLLQQISIFTLIDWIGC